MRTLQLPNGCFTAASLGAEHDMRFVFCAAAISYILDDWNGMDKAKTAQFIIDSMVSALYNETVKKFHSVYCSRTTVASAKAPLSNRIRVPRFAQSPHCHSPVSCPYWQTVSELAWRAGCWTVSISVLLGGPTSRQIRATPFGREELYRFWMLMNLSRTHTIWTITCWGRKADMAVLQNGRIVNLILCIHIWDWLGWVLWKG